MGIWILGFMPGGFLQVDASDPESGGLTISELTALAIPAAMAILIMYRLVPLHKLMKCLRTVNAEQKRRNAR